MKYLVKNKINIIYLLLIFPFLQPPIINEYPFLDNIFLVLKIVSFLIIIVFYAYKLLLKKVKIDSFIIILSIYFIFLGLSTLFNSASLTRFLSYSIPTISLVLISHMWLVHDKKSYVKYASNLLFIYIIINFITIIFSTLFINNFNDTLMVKYFFLGEDNRFIFVFLLSIYLCFLDDELSNSKLSLKCFLNYIICLVTLIYRWSVAAMVGTIFLGIILFIIKFTKINWKKNIYNILIVFPIIYLLIIVFKAQYWLLGVFELLFNKRQTLESRYMLWDRAFSFVKDRPFFGYGIESVKLLKEKFIVNHSHNMFFQLMYESGFVGLFLYILMFILIIRNLIREKSNNISKFSFAIIFIILLLGIFDTFNHSYIFLLMYLVYKIIDLNHNDTNKKDYSIKEYVQEKFKNNKILYFISKYIYRFYYNIILFRIVATFFKIFPVNSNKVIVCSYFGSDYSDNPKFIVESLLEKDKENKLIIIWALRKELLNNNKLPNSIKTVRYGSLKYLFELTTSKIWIDNSRKDFAPIKRKSQFYIQTWHGGIALKKVEKFAEDALSKTYCKKAIEDSKNANLFISNSKWEDELYREAFWYNGEIYTYGLPRNDILFKKDKYQTITKKIRDLYSINDNVKILLYAPTFRHDKSIDCYNIDLENVLNELERETNDNWICMVRLHPNVIKLKTNIIFSDKILNMTSYPDLNELMISANMLITDYSSLMFDFSYMDKPIFLFTNDINNYKDDRGFLFDLYKLPFDVCENNDELICKIKKFNNDEYLKKLHNFYEKLGLNETGKSSDIIAERILKECGIDEK